MTILDLLEREKSKAYARLQAERQDCKPFMHGYLAGIAWAIDIVKQPQVFTAIAEAEMRNK